MLMDRNWLTQRGAFANNGDFVLNIIEKMIGGVALSDLRGKGTSFRPFEKIIELEKVAEETPEKILSFSIDPTIGFQPFHSRLIANTLNLKGSSFKQAGMFFKQLYKLFTDLDGSLLEINPLVVTSDNDLIALDAKMSFDNNALFRHPNIMELRDETEEDPAEIIASKYDLAYIKFCLLYTSPSPRDRG